MAEEKQQDVETLKRRGRRRLVGAVALVLAAVIVLPMVFDPEPRGTAAGQRAHPGGRRNALRAQAAAQESRTRKKAGTAEKGGCAAPC